MEDRGARTRANARALRRRSARAARETVERARGRGRRRGFDLGAAALVAGAVAGAVAIASGLVRSRATREHEPGVGAAGGPTGAAAEGNGPNVGTGERALSGVAGGLLALGGVRRGGAAGITAGALGATLVARGMTGRCALYRALGVDTARKNALCVRRAVTVGASPEEAYRLWRDLDGLPRFLRHVRSVHVLDDRRSRWTIDVSGHPDVAFDAEITADVPNEGLEWRTLPGQPVQHEGAVRFSPAPGGRGTVVEVDLVYRPEAGGAFGRAYARLLERVTAQQVKEDLRRFKQVLEAGETPRVAGQPAGAGRSRSR